MGAMSSTLERTGMERTGLVLRDGTAIGLEELTPAHRDDVRRLLEGLSARSRRLRFLQPVPVVPDSLVRLLSDADGVDHVALLARAEGAPVAMARWIRTRDRADVADLALTVTDDLQGRGLGRALLVELCRRAVDGGVRHLTYSVSPENRRSSGLLASLGGRDRLTAGLVEGVLDPAAVVGTAGRPVPGQVVA